MRNDVPPLELTSLTANGIQFQALTRKYSDADAPLVIFLHGFPDTPLGFVSTMDALAVAGYRSIAPYMRGYSPTGLAPDGDYRQARLGEDVLALASACGAERFAVVGHDWGALAAYAAAVSEPDRLTHLITAAVPHPAHSVRNMTFRQFHRSLYTLLFLIPLFPEWLIRRHDFAWLEALIARWSPNWDVPDSTLQLLKQNFRDPQRLAAALEYYRSSMSGMINAARGALAERRIRVPTLQICGAQDGCVGAEVFIDQEEWFTAGLSIEMFANAGHFMQYERPDAFARAVLRHLAS